MRFGGFKTTKSVEPDDPSNARSLLFVTWRPPLEDVTFTEAVGSKADSRGVALAIAAGALVGRYMGGRRGVAGIESVVFDAPTLRTQAAAAKLRLRGVVPGGRMDAALSESSSRRRPTSER